MARVQTYLDIWQTTGEADQMSGGRGERVGVLKTLLRNVWYNKQNLSPWRVIGILRTGELIFLLAQLLGP